LAVATFSILIALGVWQLQRKDWKENLIATLAERMSAAPSLLPPRTEWQNLTPAADEFRRVRMRAQFDPNREARVYSGGAGLRDDVKTPGYFAFAPARLVDGSSVVVNRGHVDNPNPDASLKPIAVPDNAVDIVGVLRWPEPPGWFVSLYSERQDLWFARDHRAMAERYGWGDVAPFYIEMESPAPAGGVPRPGKLTVKLRNDHFGYALTWFGLAAVLVGVFGFWAVRRR
jgi:cytochrome oxidase assembly protein ShyY1